MVKGTKFEEGWETYYIHHSLWIYIIYILGITWLLSTKCSLTTFLIEWEGKDEQNNNTLFYYNNSYEVSAGTILFTHEAKYHDPDTAKQLIDICSTDLPSYITASGNLSNDYSYHKDERLR